MEPVSSRGRPALAAAALITGGLLLLGAATDLPALLGGGFFSDCATYYALATSIAHDFDLEYSRADLQRVYADFSGGPSGIFLQRNPDDGRLYYGKAYIYPLALAPAVWAFGHRGVLVTHALLLGAVLLGMTLLWQRRWGTARALGTALAFVLPSVATVYYFWIAPEFFNFATVFGAYFLWLYKELNPLEEGESPPRWRAALLTPWTDVAAAVLLGVAMFSKLSNGALALPLLLYLPLRRRWARALLVAATLVAAALLLFGVQHLATGNWNYQGGERKSFTGEYPYAIGRSFDTASETSMETNLGEYRPPFYPLDIAHNVLYFFVGRFGGIVPYYFPAVLALVLFLALGRRPLCRWLVLGGAAAAALVYIVLIPTNVIGGGGTVANRYFMNIMPLLLFLLPARTTRWAPVLAAVAGAALIGHILISPLQHSHYPSRYAEAPLLRMLPAEWTMLNDLPINTEPERRRVPWFRERGGELVRDEHGRPVVDFFVYHMDHDSYAKEPNPFAPHTGPDSAPEERRYLTEGGGQQIWTAGGRTAELVLRSAEPLRRLRVRLTNSNCANTVTLSVQGKSRTLRMEPRRRESFVFELGPAFAYHYLSTSYIYPVAVSTSNGVTPRTLPGGANDWRHLGAMLEFWVEE